MSKKEFLTALSTAYGEFSLSSNAAPARGKRGYSALLERLERTKAVERLADFYSKLLEERVTARCTLHLLHAQVAGLFLIFPVDASVAYRMVCLAWLALACLQCKRHLSKAAS